MFARKEALRRAREAVGRGELGERIVAPYKATVFGEWGVAVAYHGDCIRVLLLNKAGHLSESAVGIFDQADVVPYVKD